jgi:hypothetical protein
VADLLTCLGVVAAVVHQPGDVLIALPAMVVAAAVWWRRRHESGWALLAAAVIALSVPYAHLFVIDTAIRSVLGGRVAGTVDGVAVVLCWLLLVVLAVRLSRQVAARRVTSGVP